jgi:hypothetical protein
MLLPNELATVTDDEVKSYLDMTNNRVAAVIEPSLSRVIAQCKNTRTRKTVLVELLFASFPTIGQISFKCCNQEGCFKKVNIAKYNLLLIVTVTEQTCELI